MERIKDLKEIWKNGTIDEYKSRLAKKDVDELGSMVSFIKCSINKSLDNRGFEFYKASVDWLRQNNVRHLGAWSNVEYELITKASKDKFKGKNKNFLKILSLYTENKNIIALPWVFSKYWPDGWKLFEPYMEQSKNKKNYLINSFMLASPQMRQDIESIYSQEEIRSIIKSDKNIAKNQFWGSHVHKNIEPLLSDEHILRLLIWSKGLSVGIEPHHNARMYLKMKYPKTIEFLVGELGIDNLQSQLIEKHTPSDKRKEEIQELNSYLLSCKLEKELSIEPKKDKKMKI